MRPRAQWPFAAAMTGMGIGLGVVATGNFPAGTVLFALSVLGAAVLRALLPERAAGLLAVRSRAVDAMTLGALGAGLTVLALVIPSPPG